MKISSHISGFFILIILLSSLPSAAYGADSSFVFNDREAVSGWRFEHVEAARFTGGGLLIEGNRYVRIGPPKGAILPSGRIAMALRFKTRKNLVCNIRIKASDGGEAAKTILVKALDGSADVTSLRVYLGKTGKRDSHIKDFVLEFSGIENTSVRLDGIRIYEPSAAEIASILWEEFWRLDFVSINLVDLVVTPRAGGVGLMTILYVLTGIFFLSSLVFYRFSGKAISYRKAGGTLIIISIAAGALFILRMDYKWAAMLRDDVKTLSGKDVSERIDIVNNRDFDNFFDFIDFVRASVPPGGTIRPAVMAEPTPLATMARYYLLPLENSRNADFLWSFGEVLTIDPLSGGLYAADGRLIAPKAGLFAKFADNAAVYKVIR